MLVVGKRETARDPHLLDRRRERRPLGLCPSHPVAEQGGVTGVSVRHALILRLPTNANTLDQ